MQAVQGLHHITAVASDPQRNVDFYHHVLGQRLVKKTVNFDDPGTYHLYYGDEVGTPGTIMTFFPWQKMARGRRGNGETAAVAYSIRPESALVRCVIGNTFTQFTSVHLAACSLRSRLMPPAFITMSRLLNWGIISSCRLGWSNIAHR